jgi:hypothetical protein
VKNFWSSFLVEIRESFWGSIAFSWLFALVTVLSLTLNFWLLNLPTYLLGVLGMLTFSLPLILPFLIIRKL